jgi:2-dehydro-3-deoxyphosphogluconate aldolase/(4S)-4-hydroxy-2-oxoglutarate aldolase
MTTATTSALCSELGTRFVVAVVRSPTADLAVSTAEALMRGGITAVEITFTTPGAASAISRLAALRGLMIGAGTVVDREQSHQAIRAGAAFLVSPGTYPDVLDAAEEEGVLAIPGVFTPSEIGAVCHRVPLLKLFPASLGGPGLLRSLKGPYPGLRFMPSGGVTLENVTDWRDAGAFAVGAGGDLCSERTIRTGDFEAIERQARRYAEVLT